MKYYMRLVAEGIRHPSKVHKTVKNILHSRSVQTYFVSYPKTGRTWLRVLIGKALICSYSVREDLLLDTCVLTSSAGLPPAMFTHDGPFELFDMSPYQKLSFNTNKYSGKKVVFMIRDIRDTVVSSYFQECKRMNTFQGSMQEFVRDQNLGIRKIIRFYSMWFENQNVPESFLLVRYEDMKANPAQVGKEVLAFMGTTDLPAECLDQAVSFASFDNMKKMETKGEFRDTMLKPGEKSEGESFKVRRGKIGGFVDYLSTDDLQYIDEQVKELGNASCDWYYVAK
jgi:hypothetical protein